MQVAGATRRSTARRRCPSGGRSRGTGHWRRFRGAQAAVRRQYRCRGQGTSRFWSRVLAGTTTGSAADPNGPRTSATRPRQSPAATRLSVFLPSHGRGDGSGARSGRSWASRPAKLGPAGRREAVTGPGTQPYMYHYAVVFPPRVNGQAPLSVKTFRKRKEKRFWQTLYLHAALYLQDLPSIS